MIPNEVVAAGKVIIVCLPMVVSIAIGLRFILYSEDGFNLDKLCRKAVINARMQRQYITSRERDRIYRNFTRVVGVILILFACVYWIYSPISNYPFALAIESLLF